MAAVITRGTTYGATETLTNAKLHALVDSATIAGIVNAEIASGAAIVYTKLSLADSILNSDINSGAAIVDTKLAQITTASKVHGSAITGLTSVPSGAGALPIANVAQDLIVKAWINFNGTGTIAERDSYNVSSIVDEGTGDYTINWDTDFADVNYAWAGGAQLDTSSGGAEADVVALPRAASMQLAGSIRINSVLANTAKDCVVVTLFAIGAQ